MGGRHGNRCGAVLSGVQPEAQAKKFDPDGAYVAQWVPEYGTDDYPEPILDHKAEREEALRRFGEI